MFRSVSEPSLGTIGNSTIETNATRRTSRHIFSQSVANNLRGKYFWKGRLGKITQIVVTAPWNIWFQALVLITIVYEYVLHLLLAYYLEESYLLLDIVIFFGEVIFLIDVFVLLLHAYWPLLRLHIRVCRRSSYQLFYDVFTLTPLSIIFHYKGGHEYWLLFGRWLIISRIYRLFAFFQAINEQMRSSRKLLYLIEHFMSVLLILHGCNCLWHGLHRSYKSTQTWHIFGFPDKVNMRKLEFKSYVSCGYYCACRIFNIIFGDAFPLTDRQKWLTSALMLFGYVCMRYRFIGSLTWEIVLENSRKSKFVDRYEHMIRYLKSCGANRKLEEQAKKYKEQLWEMKRGVLTSRQLHKLPHPLQMELIFDINVGHFHSSMLFRDTSEAFMRQISLLMRHEIFLAGQHIWSQGLVKNGMICVKQGVIEMLSDEDDESPMISFKKGTVLGELSLFYSVPSKVTVQAATYVELQVLRRTELMRVIAEYPNILQHIRTKIQNRVQDSRRKQAAIMKYDEGDFRLIRTRYRPMKVLKDNLAGVEDEDPTFVDDSHMYYKDENNIRQPKFTKDYLELYEIATNVTTIDYPRICLKSKFPWILEPNTNFTYMWDTIHFTLVLYICLMSPHSAINDFESDVEKVLRTIVVAGLLLNIYIQLTTAIVKKNIRKETVKEIAEEKMSSFGFYLDIISVFPVYIFTDTLDPEGQTIAGQVAKLFPIVQVWHIWDYIGKWENKFNTYPKLLCLLKFTMLFFIFSYWSGCLLYMIACPGKLCRENSWMSLLIYWETKVFMTNEAKHERPMMTSFNFGTSIFTNTGSSDIAPGSSDLIVVVFLFTLGMYLSCFYSAKICSLYLLSTQRKLKFKESIRELFYFLTVNHVSGKIKVRVKKFFCVQWYYNNAVSTDEIFKNMSANIQQEVMSIETVETLLYCPLFQGCSRDFLQTVAANTRTIVLPDNEIVQHAADIGRDMYILQKGHCDLLHYTCKVSMSIGPGSHFGVIEMLFGLPKVYTVLTTTNCILLHVEYAALVQCWGTFPDISHPIITALEDQELCANAKYYEDAKPMIGRMDNKTNRIAQEIKESFVVFNGREERAQYVKAFQMLGVMRHLRYLFVPACITPHGMFLKFWCTVRFCLAIFYIITVPYDIATRQHKFGRGYNWMDIILYIDIILMSYVAYYDHRSLLVTHPLFTVSRYMKHAFLLDLLSVFPFEQLVWIINDKTDLDFYRINRILLVTRMTSAFSFWESDIMQVNTAVVLLKYLPIAVTLVNLSTSFIFTASCTPYLPEDSYFILVNCSRIIVISSTKYDIKYAVTEYIYTFYWAYEIFVGLGCTPIAVRNSINVWLIMLLQIVGFLYFAFMLGYVASTRSAAAHALLEHSEYFKEYRVPFIEKAQYCSQRIRQIYINEKTRDLANFLYQENVDVVMTAKTLKYFEYVWTRTNGSNPQEICRGLNSALMEDTLVFMYERALREVPLFGNVERSFIRVITQHLHEMYFLKGDTVIQCKDIQRNIYIIYRGKVDVLTSYNEMITCMGPGGMFGNFSGQSISCSEVTIYASRSLDLLMLPSQTFFNLVKYYPKIQEPLNKAFEVSRDYILPITMDIIDDDTSEESGADLLSWESAVDSRSGSSRFEISGQISVRSSTSTMSQGKSSTSVMTYQSYTHPSNLLKPGTLLFQSYGYFTCIMATANYAMCLYELTTLNDCYLMFWFQAAFDIYFYVKTFLTIHQGYINKHGELITIPNKCRRRYFKHKDWLWTDILVNMPLELFSFCFPQPVRYMHYLRANKLLRLKYLIEFYRQTSAELTNNLTVLQSAMTIIVVIVLIHTFTCVWLLALMATSPICLIRTLKSHLIDEETSQRRWDYTTSFYVVVSVLTTTGGNEFVITETIPIVILAVILVCGKMLAAIVVATAIQVAYSTKYALNKYEKMTGELKDMFKNQGLSTQMLRILPRYFVDFANIFINEENIGNLCCLSRFLGYQMQKFWVYVQQLWVTERGRQPLIVNFLELISSRYSQDGLYLSEKRVVLFLRTLPALLEQTPYVRRCDLMTAMFGQHLRNCYLFADTGEVFLRQLSACMEYTVFFAGNYIVVAGDCEARMYWVNTGTVSVVSVQNDLTEITHELLEPGDVFGILQGINRGVSHTFSYRAETKVSVLSLNLDSWINILPYFPEARRRIIERTEILFAEI